MMKNLIERAEMLQRGILDTQIAEMNVFRVSSYVKIILFNIYYYIQKLLGVFSEGCRRKAQKEYKKTFNTMLDESRSRFFKEGDEFNELKKQVRFHSARCFSFVSPGNEDTDVISSAITHSACKILRKKELSGKSVYELNDMIYRIYSDKRKHDYVFYLHIWLVSSIIIPIFIAVLFHMLYISLIYAAVLVLILLAIDYVVIQRKISIWHMAKLIWVILAETKSEIAAVSGMVNDSENDHKMIEIRMRTLHTLVHSYRILDRDISSITEESNGLTARIKQNDEMMRGLLRNTGDEARRTIAVKREENEKLELRLRENNDAINMKSNAKKNADSAINKLLSNLVPIYRDRWKMAYGGLSVPDDVIKNTIIRFSFSDIPFIEKRMSEIENTKNPTAIAKKVNNQYLVELMTSVGTVATILFSEGDTKGIVK